MKSNSFRTFAVAITLVLTTAALAQPAGSVTIGLTGEPPNLDPALNSGTPQRSVKLSVYRGLFNYGMNGKPAPELASSYTLSTDKKTYTIKLRKASFHNGDPVTAEDVKFTIERILDPKTGATFAGLFKVVSTINAVNATTIQITLKEPTAPFIHYLALPESAIVSKKWTQQRNGDLSRAAMGAGPFKFTRWERGQSITLEAFDGYYKANMPKSKQLVFEFYAEETARVNALRAGNVDLIEYVPWKDIQTVRKDTNLKLYPSSGPFMGVVFNTTSKPFSDPRVRQAVGYAINRQAIINTAFSGQGRPIYGIAMPTTMTGYNKDLASYYKYDQKKAMELLAAAGYPNGFKIRLLSTSQYGFHQQTATVIAAELKKIGITVELDLPDWATRLEKNLKADYDLLVIGTAGDINDPDFLTDIYKSGPLRLNSAPGFADKQIDNLLEEGRSTTETAKRADIYQSLQKRLLDLSPVIYLSWREQAYASNKNIQGFTPMPGFLNFQSGLMFERIQKK